ncbi:4a-hydroxytetrahydrobiopterin dehydratase, partial [Mannheimia haemolytica]
MAELLSDTEIDAALTNLPHWRRDGASLTRTIESASFPAAIALVDRV